MDQIIKHILKPDILLICIMIIVFALGRFVFKMRYASISAIFLNYMSCFKKRDGKLLIVPIIYYFGIPFIMALLAVRHKRMDNDIINIITIIVSILTAMLFELLSTIIEMKSKIKQDPTYYSMDAHISNNSLIQTYYTVMFAIMLSIIILILCLFNVFVKEYSYIQSFLVYYLVFMLLVNLFMILKRIYNVIDLDMGK